MVLEGRGITPEDEAKEMADVVFMTKELYGHPDAELKKIFGIYDLMEKCGLTCLLIFFASAILNAVVLSEESGKVYVLFFCLVIITISVFSIYIFYLLYIRNKMCRKLIKTSAEMIGRSSILLNEEGVFLQTDGNTTSGIRWDRIDFVRFFSKCIIFFPNGGSGKVILISRYHEQPVREFLSIYHSDIPIY